MNRFLTFEGKQPIWLDDINFMNDAVAEALSHLIDGLANGEDCILWGVERGGGSHRISEGAMCINGEILPVRPYDGPDSDSLAPVVKHSYSGRRTTKSGEQQDCWDIRYIDLEQQDDSPSIDSYPRILDIINKSGYASFYETGDIKNPKIATTLVGDLINVAGTFTVPASYVDDTPGILTIAEIDILLPAGFNYDRLGQYGAAGFNSPIVAVNQSGEPLYGYINSKYNTLEQRATLTIKVRTTLSGEVSFNTTI